MKKIFMYSMYGIIGAILIYLLIDVGSASGIISSYNSVRPNSSSSHGKQLEFLRTYSLQTSDFSVASSILGVSNDEAFSILGGSRFEGYNSNINHTYGSYSDNDLRPLAQAVADAMISKDGMDSASSNAGHDIYSTVNGGYYTVFYNGDTQRIKFRCCTTMVVGIMKLLGAQQFITDTQDSYGTSNWVNWLKNKDYTIKASDLQWSDIQVGDILLRSGHTEIVVYKDSSGVYIANGGNDGDGKSPDNLVTGIYVCSSVGDHPGYSYKKTNLSETISSSGWEYVVRY